jgi:hypothetical protein
MNHARISRILRSRVGIFGSQAASQQAIIAHYFFRFERSVTSAPQA